jgi:hypothetical protein
MAIRKIGAELAQQLLVHGRIQAIHRQMRMRHDVPNVRDRLDHDPRSGVHANVYRDRPGVRKQGGVEPLQRKIDAFDVEPGLFQPCARLGRRERLPPAFVRID